MNQPVLSVSRNTLIWLGAVVAVLVLVAAWLVLRDDPRVEHEVAEDPRDPVSVPGTVSDVAWEWTEEGVVQVPTVSPLPFGVLVHVEHGVAALDGSTGEEVWSYRVEGTPVQAEASPSGAYVQLFYADEPDPEEPGEDSGEQEEADTSSTPGQRVVLDGATGEVLSEEEMAFDRDVESMGGVWSGGLITDHGVLSLESEGEGETARMAAVDEESHHWSVPDAIDCPSGNVDTVGTAVFEESVVLRSTCESGEVFLVAFDPVDGLLLWSLHEEEHEQVVRDGGIRAAGDVLVVHENAPTLPPGGVPSAERLVLDPVSGEVLGEGVDLEEDQNLAATVEEGYLVLNRTPGHEQVFGYELRSFEGETLMSTGDEAVSSANALAFGVPLQEALVTLEAGSARGEPGRSSVKVSEWGADEEAAEVRLPRLLSSGLRESRESVVGTFSGLERFIAAPGAVVLVEWTQDWEEEGDMRILGLQ